MTNISLHNIGIHVVKGNTYSDIDTIHDLRSLYLEMITQQQQREQEECRVQDNTTTSDVNASELPICSYPVFTMAVLSEIFRDQTSTS
jgi:hypothetical protein